MYALYFPYLFFLPRNNGDYMQEIQMFKIQEALYYSLFNDGFITIQELNSNLKELKLEYHSSVNEVAA